MRWRKMGKVFEARGQFDWMRTHAAVPFAVPAADGTISVFFASRDVQGRSHTAQLHLSLGDSFRVLGIEPEPVLSPGAPGCFDDSGALPSWIANVGGERWMYYIGWNNGTTVPFRNSIGLAIDRGAGRFERYAIGPVMDRSLREPFFATNPCVLNDGDVWKMWYLSCIGWPEFEGKLRHRYKLKYVESSDGIDWRPDGCVAIDFSDDSEYAISRPCVVRDGSVWKMWYSVRGAKYRIGYAESNDGREWVRRDDLAGITVSDSGWDSDSVEYAHVFDHDGTRYMLYNGNDFGATGFGMAILDDAR